MFWDIDFLQSISAEKFNRFYYLDEVGRGPLAGPVVSCCVMINTNDLEQIKNILAPLHDLGINDSKKLSEKKRQHILQQLGINIAEMKAEMTESLNIKGSILSYSISSVEASVIDKVNILQASLLAMKQAAMLQRRADGVLIVDGNQKVKLDSFPCHTVIKGDSKSILIGLASIIAKEFRDNLMNEVAKRYPAYGFEKHSGYPTAEHLLAISQFGVLDIHRKTFKGVKEFVLS